MSADAAATKKRTPTWAVATISAVFGLFYAYALWNAVGLLVLQASGIVPLNGYGWFVLSLPVVFPLIVFGGAFALGYRRGGAALALLLLTGLALVAVFWLDIVAYAAVAGTALLL